jgi:hypothetical protein
MLHVNKPPMDMFEFQKTKAYLRKKYAQYGRASGVDPGIMWPTREEITRMTDAERDLGIPTLQESWTRVADKRKTTEDVFRKRIERVDANMAKMAGEIAAFRKRQQKVSES